MVPQIIVLAYVAIYWVLELFLHGKPKQSKHDFYTVVIQSIMALFVLHRGGFFDNILK